MPVPTPIDEASERVRELLERILDETDVDADVEVRVHDGGLVGEYLGEDVGLLIGRRGETIDAIQHLAYRFATRGDGDRIPVLVDADGYRERRAETLRQAADHAAQSAVSGGQPVALDAMSALERKVIHEHLKSRHDIETYSEGQEPSRHLVVAPLL
jgi:spoIIIJ-associated protein